MEKYRRETKEKFDDLYFEFMNKYRYSTYLYKKFFLGKHTQLKKNIDLKNKHIGKRCFVIGNAPSVKYQKIEALKNEIVFMVNRGFLDPRYEIIKPKYHIIIDPKLGNGEWPITFLDEISAKNPDVTFLLNSAWYDSELFENYKYKFKIYWIDQGLEFTPYFKNRTIDLTKRTHSKFVVEQAITTAIYMGISEIYFTGVEGNGLAYLMLNQDSHSYGANKEDLEWTWINIARACYHCSYWLRCWQNLDQFCSLNKIKLYNLTKGGVMDMVERKNFNEVLNL